MPLIEEDAPKKKRAHEVGEDLTTLSVDELSERIALLRAEIARLEGDIASKKASANVAASFFKR